MPVLTRSRQALRATGTATAAAPYVREAATDSELRDGLRTTLHSLRRIYDEMSADQRLRDRLFAKVAGEAAVVEESSSGSRPRLVRRVLRAGFIVTAAFVGLVAIGAALAYPRSRRRITSTVGGARDGVTSITSRVRRRSPGAADQSQQAMDEMPGRISEAA